MQTETPELSNEPGLMPASFAQQRLWFLDQFEGSDALYNVPVATRLRGPLDVAALERALDALVARHEPLRTGFKLVDGVPHQAIRPHREFSLLVTDLSNSSDAERRGLEIVSEHAREPFDLSAGEPFRARLVKLGQELHLLSLTLHHIVTDAWSMGVLHRELSKLYDGFVEGREVELPELPIQYADYAVWQQQWMESGGLDEQLDYWRTQLAGAPALLELPTDHPRPARQSFRGATVRTTLAPELLERLNALGEAQGATLFMTLLAALAALLSRYSGQEDVVIASPVANRGRIELESVIGLFVNTLALRIDVDGDKPFQEVLRGARETALGAFSNQDLPFEKLVEQLNPERHLSHAPVAQVLFVMQNAVERPVTFSGLEQERILTERGTAKFDLSFFAAETADGLRLSLEYCTDLLEQESALRILEHFRVLLESAVNDPARPVGELELLSAPERELVLGSWSQSIESQPFDALRPVHEVVTEQAQRTPDAPAVLSAGEELSYAELEARSNQLARCLRGFGVGPEVVVAICAERSVEMVLAVLAVLKAGGAYAPIDPAYPEDRVAFMLADTNAPVLLTQERLLAGLPDHGARIVCLDTDRELIDSHDDGPLDPSATLDELAYVIYTSGSTGRPKGVAMAHRPLSNLIAWQNLSAPAAARTLQFASLSFDVAFQEIFSTWCSGGTLVLLDEAERRDPEALLRFVTEQQIERLFVPFVALHGICEAAAHLGATIPSLHEVITAGEQVKATDALRGFFAAHPSCTLVNHYGPTEGHVVSAHTLIGPPAQWPALPPIGRPITGARIYLLDRHGEPVPIGVPGELHIGGASLARGYLNRSELTDERFVPDPFSEVPQARMYRTGDLCRHLPGGEIEYLGRSDYQLKIRGFRVEPGEIEAVLREHRDVADAVVVGRDDGAGGKRLVAYVVGEHSARSVDELRGHLRRSVPDYMVPSAFEFLDAFPLNPNGKVDRTRLAFAPLAGVERVRERILPRTDTERRLAAIWRRLLDIEEVGVDESFFELGGHSLMAVRLFAEIERRLDVRLPLSALFETATIAGLGELVERECGGETVDWSALIEMSPGNGQRPLFLIGWAGGEVLPYRELVENLDSGLPVLGLRAPGVDRRTAPLASVEDLAAHYVQQIRVAQPHGPYRLGGFCFSGLVAYEIARLLREDGEELELLALIDAYPYRPPRPRGVIEHERAKLKAFRDADLRGKAAWLPSRLAGLGRRARLSTYLKAGPRLYELAVSRRLQHLVPRRPLNLVLIASNLARQRYVPRPLDVHVEFFRAQRVPGARGTPWEGLAGRGVELRQIVAPDIDHDGMMHEPHVRLLATELTRALQEAAS
ncbi:MAG TPA: amino acid adenylation domain-containing protein [Solirubrobacteraceae bacterium]